MWIGDRYRWTRSTSKTTGTHDYSYESNHEGRGLRDSVRGARIQHSSLRFTSVFVEFKENQSPRDITGLTGSGASPGRFRTGPQWGQLHTPTTVVSMDGPDKRDGRVDPGGFVGLCRRRPGRLWSFGSLRRSLTPTPLDTVSQSQVPQVSPAPLRHLRKPRDWLLHGKGSGRVRGSRRGIVSP